MINPGQTTTAYAIERGNPMVLLTIRTDGASAADVAELQAVLASVQCTAESRLWLGSNAALGTCPVAVSRNR